MHQPDFAAFGELLDATCSLLSRGNYAPSAQNTALFFNAVRQHSLADVRAAFEAHIADPVRGKFPPVPADINAQLIGRAADDGRPGAEEAWAIALRGADERATVVWTDEAAKAWAIARPVFDQGDEVGARMAFKESYARLVDEARRARRGAAWIVSEGHDPQLRDVALMAASEAGRLAAPERLALPAPTNAFDALTANPAMPAEVRENLLRLRDAFVARAAAPSADVLGRERTEQLKQQMAERVNGYTGAQS